MSYTTSGPSTLKEENNKEKYYEYPILESVNEGKRSRWEEIKRRRHEDEMEYLREIFPSIMENYLVKGTIIKLDVNREGEEEDPDSSDYGIKAGVSDYEKKTGAYFLDEKTLIIADRDGNIYLVFVDEEGNFVEHITDAIHIIRTCKYDKESYIHKRHMPTRIPGHLRPLVIINNTTVNKTVNNITKTTNNINNMINFGTLKISDKEELEFLRRNYKPGGMYLLTEMKRHPEWMPKYRHKIKTEKLQICKSCGNKSVKNCCIDSSPKNRKVLTMVIGWH